MKDIIKKADVLIEVLPYVKSFRRKVFVIKYGGSLMQNAKTSNGILEDIVFLNLVGIKPILIHGGGDAITQMMKKAGLKAKFVDGFRITDEKTVRIVDKALSKLNRQIMSKIKSLGARVLGLVSQDNVIRSTKDTTYGDIGYVGKITSINTHLIHRLLEEDLIPVIAPVGIGNDGKCYNINADIAASTIASHMKAQKLILLTDVKGVMMDLNNKRSLVSTLKVEKANSLIKRKVINEGMIPKVSACIDALNKGLAKAHIIDGRIPHALLLEIFTDKGIGTEIIK